MNETQFRATYGIADRAVLKDKAKDLIKGKGAVSWAGYSNIPYEQDGKNKRLCKVAGNHIYYRDIDSSVKPIDTTWIFKDGFLRPAATRHHITIDALGNVDYSLGSVGFQLAFGAPFEVAGHFATANLGNGLTVKLWTKGAKFEKWITGVGHPNLPLSPDSLFYELSIPMTGLPDIGVINNKASIGGEVKIRGGRLWNAAESVPVAVRLTGTSIVKYLPVSFFENGVEWTTDATAYYAGAGDGDVRAVSDAVWVNTRNDTTGASNTDATSPSLTLVDVGATYDIYRSFLPIDTSGIADGSTVSAAVLNLFGTDKGDADNDGQDYIVVVEGTQASTASLENTDIDNVGSTAWSDTIDIGAYSTVGYNQLTLNATGRNAVSKTGVTKLALREGHDMENAAPVGQNYTRHATSEAAGTDNDPYLDVTVTTPFTPKIIIIS